MGRRLTPGVVFMVAVVVVLSEAVALSLAAGDSVDPLHQLCPDSPGWNPCVVSESVALNVCAVRQPSHFLLGQLSWPTLVYRRRYRSTPARMALRLQ